MTASFLVGETYHIAPVDWIGILFYKRGILLGAGSSAISNSSFHSCFFAVVILQVKTLCEL